MFTFGTEKPDRKGSFSIGDNVVFRLINFFSVLLILGGAFLIGRVFWKKENAQKGHLQPNSPTVASTPTAEERKQETKISLDKYNQYRSAATTLNPALREQALRDAKSSNLLVKKGAIHVLGKDPDPAASKTLNQLLENEKDPVMIGHILDALSFVPTPERENAFKGYLREIPKSKNLEIKARAGLAKVTPSKSERSIQLKKLKNISENDDQENSKKALFMMAQVDPKSPETLRALLPHLTNPSIPEVQALAIKIVGQQKPEVFQKNIRSLTASKEAIIQTSVIQSLVETCHPSRKTYFQQYAKGSPHQSIKTMAEQLLKKDPASCTQKRTVSGRKSK